MHTIAFVLNWLMNATWKSLKYLVEHFLGVLKIFHRWWQTTGGNGNTLRNGEVIVVSPSASAAAWASDCDSDSRYEDVAIFPHSLRATNPAKQTHTQKNT